MQKSTQKGGNNLQHTQIPNSARQLSSFSVLGDSQESQSTVPDEEVEVGDGSDESELSHPSFNHPSEVFQDAFEDPVQTLGVFSAPANSQGAGFVTHFTSSLHRSK